LTGLFAAGVQALIERLTRLLCQFKPNRLASFLLANGRPICCIAVRGDVLDLQCYDIAGPEFAVDCQIEHRKVACSPLRFKLAPD
jgi:hypothetical protein